MIYITFLIVYVIVGLLYGLTLNLLIVESIGQGDYDFDSAVADNSTRFIAVLILSVIWIIALPTHIILNKISEKGEDIND